MNKPMREGFVERERPQVVVEVPSEPTPQEAPQAPPQETWPVTVRLLHKPVRNMKGEMVKELNFREPSARDIMHIGGNPVRLNDRFETVIDDVKMLALMANLSGIVSPLLEVMDPRDFASCAYRLRGFFLPNPESLFPESPTTPTS
jgi:hypothetical protein